MLPAIHVNVTSEWYHFEPLNVTCYSCECYLWMKSCWTSECGWTEYASVNWKVVAVRLNFLLYCVFSYVCNTKVTKIKLCTRSPWFMCQRLNWIPSRQLNRQVVVQVVCVWQIYNSCLDLCTCPNIAKYLAISQVTRAKYLTLLLVML